MLEELITTDFKSKGMKDEIELLTLLIEKWDDENNSFNDVDPITLLHSLMKERNLKAKDLVETLGVSKGLVSDILNYKKDFRRK
jgi:HTH-type transcriptional regulator/antitoxin HigA